MEKDEVIKKIKEADISQFEWQYGFPDIMTDKYAKGYLKAVMGQLNESLSYSSEDFRIELLGACNYDIWGK